MSEKNKLPNLREVLNKNCPDADWTIPTLFNHEQALIGLVSEIRRSYGIRLPIRSVYGCYPVMWTGGKSNLRQYTTIGNTRDSFEMNFDLYRMNHIDVDILFNNPLIEIEHLKDESCNYLLEVLTGQDNPNNGVIDANEHLSDYIRKKYPDLKQTVDIVKVELDNPTAEGKKRTAEYYTELSKRFERVVIHPDDNFDKNLLEELSKDSDKYELLVNESCTTGCEARDLHYIDVGRYYLNNWKGGFHFGDFEAIDSKYNTPYGICPAQRYHPNTNVEVKKTEIRQNQLTQEELKEIYDMGFRHFKLHGRDLTSAALMYDITIYCLDNEQIFPMIYKMFVESPYVTGNFGKGIYNL